MSMLAGAAAAQVPTEPPPVREVVDDNGVALFRGELVARQPLLTIGGDQSLSYDMIYRGTVTSPSVYGRMDRSGSTLTVTIDGKSDRFTEAGSVYTATERRRQKLSWDASTGTYTYTSRDGAVVTFEKVANAYAGYGSEGRITSATAPNGAALTYAWTDATYQSCSGGGGVGGGGNLPERRVSPGRTQGVARPGGTVRRGGGQSGPGGSGTDGGGGETNAGGGGCSYVQVYRLSSVTNAYGYQLTFQYAATDPNDQFSGVNGFLRATGVTAENLAGCAPAPSCTLPTLDLSTAVNPVNVSSHSYAVGSDPAASSYQRARP